MTPSKQRPTPGEPGLPSSTPRRSGRRVALVATATLAAGLVAIPSALGGAWLPWSPAAETGTAGASPDPRAPITAVPADEPARGLVYRGLRPAKKGTPCAGTYEVVGSDHCSHGPDPAPPGLDVKKDVRPVAATAPAPRLTARDTAGTPADTEVLRDENGTLAADGSVAVVPDAAAAAAPVVGPHGVVCDGDGQSGKRVQVLYVYGTGTASRFSEYLASFRKWAAGVDTIYDASAKETGGSRHLRYVTTADCQVDVREVEVSAAALPNFSATTSELAKLGYGRADRKYMIFAESDVYCGIGSFFGDERPDATNKSNRLTAYGRSDSGCWNAGVAAHELAHNLGAVNNGAPNSNKAGHCVDEYDVMCYEDPNGALPKVVCPNRAQNQRLDCNHDDYYHTGPSPGSYLATHWNMADSQFLLNGDTGVVTPPSPSPAVPPTPVRPTPTRTAGPSVSPASPTPGPTASTEPTGGTGPTPPQPSPVRPTTAAPTTAAPTGTPTTGPVVPPGGTPAALTVGETTASTARLSWPAGPAGSRYGVVLDGRTLGWTSATGVRVTGLRAGRTYQAQIVLRTAGGSTPYTAVAPVRTAAPTSPVGGWFAMGNTLTGGAADLYGARTADRTPLVLQRSTGAANQLWQLEPAGSGSYRLRSKATGKCVAPLGRTSAGTPVGQQACAAGAAGQLWRVTGTADGFTLTTARGGLVVGVGTSRYGGQRLLVLQQPNQARHQSWTALRG